MIKFLNLWLKVALLQRGHGELLEEGFLFDVLVNDLQARMMLSASSKIGMWNEDKKEQEGKVWFTFVNSCF